jgi:hypothetical protein
MRRFAIAAILYLLSCFVYAALADAQTFKVTVITGGTWVGDGTIVSDGVIYTVRRHFGFHTPKLKPGQHIAIAIENIHPDELDVVIYPKNPKHGNKSYRYDIEKRGQE